MAADLSTTKSPSCSGSGTGTVFSDEGTTGAGWGTTWAVTAAETHSRAIMPTAKAGRSLRIATSGEPRQAVPRRGDCFSRDNPDQGSREGEGSTDRRERGATLGSTVFTVFAARFGGGAVLWPHGSGRRNVAAKPVKTVE